MYGAVLPLCQEGRPERLQRRDFAAGLADMSALHKGILDNVRPPDSRKA